MESDHVVIPNMAGKGGLNKETNSVLCSELKQV